ncbi:MAG: ABC transporter ATP-binding protein [Anaerolineales bacterium]|jgi:ABC-type multidrug transport system fused ATPase/permease subunit
MGFILDGLESEPYDRNYRDRDLLARIIAYFRPYTLQVALIALAIALNSIAGSGGPIVISQTLDLVARNPSTLEMLLLAGAVLGLGLLGWGTNFVQQWVSARVVGNVVLKLREDVFNATIRHDLSFFEEHASGKIVSRVTSDTQDFSDVVSLVVSLISQVLLVAFLTAWLLHVSWELTLLLVAMAPIAAAIALGFRRIARRVTQRARRVTAKINAQIQESVSGIMVAKAYRQERAIYNTFETNNRQAYQVGVRRGITLDTIFPIMGMTSALGIGLLVYAGGLSVRTGAVTPGDWYLFMQAVGFYLFPMMNIASFWSQFQDGLSASERVFALIDTEPKVSQVAAEPVDQLEGRIEFRHLGFTYTGREIVLPDYSLEIRPQETIALVGHTGAGKTSVANLILRFYEFQSGQLLIDGRDIRRLDLDQYRSHVGLVPQDPFLFSGTVQENIRYGKPQATQDEVIQAAMHISTGDWIEDLPQGLDTDVGERGSNLSMGQRQLVALARVLLKNPAILILDEATASVDPFTESQIQEGLSTVMRHRTSIVIAHRLSTVRHADRIVVMDRGRIVAMGTHEMLMAQGGLYAELYNTYFRHQSLASINAPSWLTQGAGG